MKRWLEAVVEWDCIEGEDGDETDWETYFEWAYWTSDDLLDPEQESRQWLLELIQINPGVWMAEACRIKHDLPSDNESIAWCGLCKEYANIRKRNRSAALPPKTLPGFEKIGGAYQLHPPCSKRALTWIRQTIYALEAKGLVERRPLEVIPDPRQGRGWDFGTRVYPK